MKILIVDDSKAMRMIIVRTLKAADLGGHEIVQASSGVEGLDLIEKEKPDLVLSDWNMPEMNGIDFLKKLREDGNTTCFGFITSERRRSSKNGYGIRSRICNYQAVYGRKIRKHSLTIAFKKVKNEHNDGNLY